MHELVCVAERILTLKLNSGGEEGKQLLDLYQFEHYKIACI